MKKGSREKRSRVNVPIERNIWNRISTAIKASPMKNLKLSSSRGRIFINSKYYYPFERLIYNPKVQYIIKGAYFLDLFYISKGVIFNSMGESKIIPTALIPSQSAQTITLPRDLFGTDIKQFEKNATYLFVIYLNSFERTAQIKTKIEFLLTFNTNEKNPIKVKLLELSPLIQKVRSQKFYDDEGLEDEGLEDEGLYDEGLDNEGLDDVEFHPFEF